MLDYDGNVLKLVPSSTMGTLSAGCPNLSRHWRRAGVDYLELRGWILTRILIKTRRALAESDEKNREHRPPPAPRG